MIPPTSDFVYRVRGSAGGARPGAHGGRTEGAGDGFAGHRSLFERPDPRRLDVRASLNAVPREWRVRTYHQRSAVTLQVLLDVSASMRLGEPATKLAVAGALVDALVRSAARLGDAVGMAGFDTAWRQDLSVAPRVGRGVGAALRECVERAGRGSLATAGVPGIRACAERVTGRPALVFLVSDFLFPLDGLDAAVRALGGGGSTRTVPIVVRDPGELALPDGFGWVPMRDVETGRARSIWLHDSARRRWREAIARQRDTLASVFAADGVRPFTLQGRLDGEALTRWFLENAP